MTSVDLVTGFLGEGKTTFIKGYGRWLLSSDLTFAVIENEFGMAGVDAAILSEEGIRVTELSGGCICCTLKVGFHDALIELADRGYKKIVVEPSGIFNPRDFFDIMKSLELSGKCQMGCMLTVVSPQSLDRMTEADRMVLAGELFYTGSVILSKTEAITPALKEKVGRRLSALLNEFFSGTKADMAKKIYDKPLLALSSEDYANLSTFSPMRTDGRLPDADHTRLFQSCTLYPSEIYTKKGIEERLSLLGDCGDVIRVKGCVAGRDGALIVNYTPDGFNITPSPQSGRPMLNIIGRGLRRDLLKKILP